MRRHLHQLFTHQSFQVLGSTTAYMIRLLLACLDGAVWMESDKCPQVMSLGLARVGAED